MKKLILTSWLLSFVFCASAQFYTSINAGVYPTRINQFSTISNLFLLNQVRSDTVRVTGTTNGWYFGNVHGADINHPFVVYVQGRQTINGGIAIENCSYVKILAPDSVVLTSGGTNGAIKGHADYIQVSGTINLNGSSGGWWIKTESPDACNYSDPDDYLFPNRMRNIWFTDFRFGNPDGSGAVGGEALYIGSTGSYGRDRVPCKGNQVLKPMWMSGIHVLNGLIFNPGRTGIQISGSDSGFNEIKNVKIYNAGRELNSSQGAGIRTGYGTNNNTEIAWNYVKNSYIYNYDLETGCNFHNNVGDSAGWWKQTKNPQQIPSVIVSAALPGSTVILKDNTVGKNSASPSTGYAIYGGSNFTNDNIICGNTPSITILSSPFNYTSDCDSVIVNTESPKDTFGFWGYLPVTQGNYNYFNDYNPVGYHIIVDWSTVRPTYAGGYVWDSILLMIDSAVKRDVFVAFQTMVGQNSPQWVLDSVGSFMTEGSPQQPGPYPKYYNSKYKSYFYQFLKDFGEFLNTLSPARRNHVLYWQIAEGSTGDEQPYKGVLDSCQISQTCTLADTIQHPALGDTMVPQDRFDPKWQDYRHASWDTAAMSAGYTAVNRQIYLMFNSGNNGSELDYINGDSTELNDEGYIESHFSFLPLLPYIKEGQLSHLYSFRGEQSYFNRKTSPSRGEVQGYIKLSTHPHKDLFMLICSALTGGLKMLNGDQSWQTMHESFESQTTPRISDFFTRMTKTKSEGFSIPAFKVDAGDTLTYPTDVYGALIDTSKAYQFTRQLYNYYNQTALSQGNESYVEWQYWRAVDKNINPARVSALASMFSNATHGNQKDSLYYNDFVVNSSYNYQKNLYQLNTSTTVIPQYRVGPDTSLFGRFAGAPKLDSTNHCSWKYDIDNSLINTLNNDTIQITITYLENGSNGKFWVSTTGCSGKQTRGDTTTISANSGLFKSTTIDIPQFKFRSNGYDFTIDFEGPVIIGFVEVKNLNK